MMTLISHYSNILNMGAPGSCGLVLPDHFDQKIVTAKPQQNSTCIAFMQQILSKLIFDKNRKLYRTLKYRGEKKSLLFLCKRNTRFLSPLWNTWIAPLSLSHTYNLIICILQNYKYTINMQLCLCSRSPPWKLNPLLKSSLFSTTFIKQCLFSSFFIST